MGLKFVPEISVEPQDGQMEIHSVGSMDAIVEFLMKTRDTETDYLDLSDYSLSWEDVDKLCTCLSDASILPSLSILDLHGNKILEQPKGHEKELEKLVGLFESRDALVYIDVSDILYGPKKSSEKVTPSDVETFYKIYFDLQDRADAANGGVLIFIKPRLLYDRCDTDEFLKSGISKKMKRQRLYHSNYRRY
jgi:hypothetical protein